MHLILLHILIITLIYKSVDEHFKNARNKNKSQQIKKMRSIVFLWDARIHKSDICAQSYHRFVY